MQTTISNLCVRNIWKDFQVVRALSNVSFDLGPGEVMAVMGPNGAGKTTLLSILSLAARPTRGEITINGRPVQELEPEIRGRIGYLSHQSLVYPDLTCRENLLFFARLHGVDNREKKIARLEESLDMAGFSMDRPARALSRGELQRLALARCLITEPDLLLLDEPATGLDQDAVRRIEGVIKEHTAKGGIAVVITHEMKVASMIATRALIMMKGQIVCDTRAPEDVAGWSTIYETSIKKATN